MSRGGFRQGIVIKLNIIYGRSYSQRYKTGWFGVQRFPLSNFSGHGNFISYSYKLPTCTIQNQVNVTLSIPVPRILKCQVFRALHPQPQPPDRTHRMVVIVSILKPRVWLLHRSDQIIARKNILEGKSPISGKSRLGNIPSIMDFRIVRNGILWNSCMPFFGKHLRLYKIATNIKQRKMLSLHMEHVYPISLSLSLYSDI